jgi:hypothetical protein
MPDGGDSSPPLMDDLFNLIDTFEKHNPKLNAKFLSPKFGSIIEDKREDMNQMLSPNLFPFYKDKDAVLPVPDLLESVGLNERERNSFMDLVIEASGASELVEDTMRIFQSDNTRVVNDEINKVNSAMSQRFHEVHSALTDNQKHEMEHQEFSFLTREQLEMIYGEKGWCNTGFHLITL